MHVPRLVAVIAVIICLNTVYGEISKHAESKQLPQDTNVVKAVQKGFDSKTSEKKKEADKHMTKSKKDLNSRALSKAVVNE